MDLWLTTIRYESLLIRNSLTAFPATRNQDQWTTPKNNTKGHQLGTTTRDNNQDQQLGTMSRNGINGPHQGMKEKPRMDGRDGILKNERNHKRSAC